MHAKYGQHVEIVQSLIVHKLTTNGIAPTRPRNPKSAYWSTEPDADHQSDLDQTPLRDFVIPIETFSTDAAKMLHSVGPEIDARSDSDGAMTPLLPAVRRGEPEVVSLLLGQRRRCGRAGTTVTRPRRT